MPKNVKKNSNAQSNPENKEVLARRRRRRSGKVLAVIGVALLLLSATLPTFAIGTGGSPIATPYYSPFDDVKLEVTTPHVYTGLSNTIYYCDFNPTILKNTPEWRSYLSIAMSTNPQTAIYVNGTTVREDATHPYLYSVQYGFDVSASNNVWGRMPLLTDGYASMLDTYIAKLRFSDTSYSTLERLSGMFWPFEFKDNSVVIKLSAIGPTEDQMYYLDDFYLSYVIEASYYTSTHPDEILTYTYEYMTEIQATATSGQYVCAGVDPIQHFLGTELYDPDIHITEWSIGFREMFLLPLQNDPGTGDSMVLDEADIEGMSIRFAGLSYNTYVDSETPFDNSYVYADYRTFIGNDFNPLDWVVDVATSFLNFTLFETINGFPVTLIGLLSIVVSVLFVIAILKLFFGG